MPAFSQCSNNGELDPENAVLNEGLLEVWQPLAGGMQYRYISGGNCREGLFFDDLAGWHGDLLCLFYPAVLINDRGEKSAAIDACLA